MKLEVINESNGTKGKIASLIEMEVEDLVTIADDLDDLTIKMINSRRVTSGRQPFKRVNQFSKGKGKSGKPSSSKGQTMIKCRYCDKEGICNRNAIPESSPSPTKVKWPPWKTNPKMNWTNH
jgi:hypothetical protein